MSLDAIKELIKKGDIPQASEQLREILAKTPEDAAARMLYGTVLPADGRFRDLRKDIPRPRPADGTARHARRTVRACLDVAQVRRDVRRCRNMLLRRLGRRCLA